MEEKFKTRYTQAAEEASMDMLTLGRVATTEGTKDASYSYIKK